MHIVLCELGSENSRTVSVDSTPSLQFWGKSSRYGLKEYVKERNRIIKRKNENNILVWVDKPFPISQYLGDTQLILSGIISRLTYVYVIRYGIVWAQ